MEIGAKRWRRGATAVVLVVSVGVLFATFGVPGTKKPGGARKWVPCGSSCTPGNNECLVIETVKGEPPVTDKNAPFVPDKNAQFVTP